MARYDDEDGYETDDRPRRRRYQDEAGEYDFRKPDLPHSGLGIASCALAAAGLLTGLFFLVLAASVGIDDFDAAVDAEDPQALLAIVVMLGAALLWLVGGALGVGGLVQRGRNKLLAAIGTAANGWLVLIGLGLLGSLFGD
jgi:hypothetical protein